MNYEKEIDQLFRELFFEDEWREPTEEVAATKKMFTELYQTAVDSGVSGARVVGIFRKMIDFMEKSKADGLVISRADMLNFIDQVDEPEQIRLFGEKMTKIRFR